MIPLAADGPWSQALGPTHFSWMFLDETPKGLPRVTPPDLWFVYRTNPAISFWDTQAVGEKMARSMSWAQSHDRCAPSTPRNWPSVLRMGNAMSTKRSGASPARGSNPITA